MTSQPAEQPPPRAGALPAGWWAPGLALAERPVPRGSLPVPADGLAAAADRLASWRAGFGTADRFAARLAAIGLDEPALYRLL
ncbi:hypothetical protein, partial [Actinophytocola sediminis]